MVDELDMKILKVVQENSRKSFREIAKDVESTTVTVINRVKKMEDSGLIQRYSVIMNHKKLGYPITGIITIQISTGQNLKSIEEMLYKHKNVVRVYGVTGEIDVIIIAKFKTLDELQEFVNNDLLESGKVRKTNTHIAHTIKKEEVNLQL